MKTRGLIAVSAMSIFAMGAYAATSPSTVTTTVSAKAAKKAAKQAAKVAANTASAVVLPTALATTTPVVQPTPTPTPTATATPTAIATQTALATVPTLAKLPALDLSNMKLWNYAGNWHASEWANWMSLTPWKYSRVAKVANGDVRFTLDSTGAPELKAGTAIRAAKDGLWEADVTLPTLRDGLVVAPLWLYNNATKDEIDFEYAGRKGLDVTVHKYVNGLHLSKTQRLFAGVDMSGKRKRFGIRVSQSSGTIKMYLDGALVHTFDKSTLGYFPTSEFRPLISMWPARSDWGNFVQWVGKWTPLKSTEQVTMIAHGYGYTAP